MGRRGLRYAAAGVVLALGAAGCGTVVKGVGEYSASTRKVADAKVKINGLKDGKPTDVDTIAGNAIADIQQFWTEKFPGTFSGKQYRGPQGGFYSVDPGNPEGEIPCVSSPSEIRGNAFYCPSKDIVAWDRVNLFPQLKDKFGPFLIAMVLAHEWGHVIQTKSGVDPDRTIVRETQADCYAGAWTRWALGGQAPHFQIERAELDNALAGYLLFRDPVGSSATDQQAHGNGFDRISAFQEGFEEDVDHCKGFTDDRQFTEISFTRQDDQERNGNLPFDGDNGALTVGQTDLEQAWPALYKDRFGKDLDKPKAEVVTSGEVQCAGKQQKKAVYFCADDNTLTLDHDGLQTVYDRVDGGDYAPMTLVGIGYAQAVAKQAGLFADGASGLLRAICLDGAYTRVVVDRPATAEAVTLSPGDLDEAIQALLFYAGLDNFFGSPGGMSGFDRVRAYRKGFTDIKTCNGL
jgi:predicted metalloprotease